MDRYDAFLFDWDGTLAQTVEIWIGVVQQCLAGRGIAVTARQIAELYGDYQMPVHLGLPAERNDEFHTEMAKAANQKLQRAVLYNDAEAVLRRLKDKGKKVALISNSRLENIKLVLDHWNIGGLFDTLITQADTKTHKPDPEGLRLALKNLNVPAANALALGDTRSDLLAAANAGVGSLLFYPPSHRALYDFDDLKTHRPTFVVNSWKELLEQL